MTEITIDFETYFDSKFSLKNLTTVEYVRGDAFKIFGCGIKIDEQPACWFNDMEVVRNIIKSLLPARIIGHNLLFDGLILVERLGLDDRQITWCDTLGLAKALFLTSKYSLGHLANEFSLQTRKLSGVLPKLSGKKVLTTAEEAMLAEYCLHDVDATWELFNELVNYMPPEELRLLDATVRMGVHAQLVLDKDMLDQAVVDAETKRAELIAASGLDQKVLSSNQQFAAYLESVGLKPPVKLSITTQKEATAFSKNDLAWHQFKDANPEYNHVFAGREAAKSTLPITRAKSFRAIAETGKLSVPLQYYGAHTGRFSGVGGINMQNLPQKSALRHSIMAPPGHVLVVGDLAQIEARVTAYLAGEQYLLDTFRRGEDIYIAFAAKGFGINPEEVTKAQRQFGKACVLALGFGMGWNKFANECRKGIMGAPPMPITDEDAQNAVQAYRVINSNIAKLWKEINEDVLPTLYKDYDPGYSQPWKCGLKLRHHAIELPNAMQLLYTNMEADERGYSFYAGKSMSNLWHGLVTENIVQALARIIMTDGLLRCIDAGMNPVFTCHDEIVVIAHESEAVTTAGELKRLMTIPPHWMPGIPLGADVGYDTRYTK